MELQPLLNAVWIRRVGQLFNFGYQQAMSCIFPVIIFASLALTKVVSIPFFHRYDLLLLICLIAQVGMVVFKLETIDELKVICMFHIIGLMLELYKVHMGSWSYPGEGWSKLFGVPLYSGFMYASVASYICQAWRRLSISVHGWPRQRYAVMVCAAIYLNFFTHHYFWDLRWVLTVLLVVVFYRTSFTYKVGGKEYRMHVVLSFLLIGFFIWLAENISTFMGAWAYPNQEHTWHIVHLGKISSWFLLVVISVIIVAQLKRVKGAREGGNPAL
ncbi:DUF817 domain-containing protein [Paenibacillus glycanilyticus]|uniref:DUF817 domain-containing protein n=1 Tax=Paenibacillus glycanilyticus TaxID=126569 RepID=UPI00203AB798|nr:DUF817 domain-containing protein [Paenibacillus glycanilyticus]MCM3631328.1 DUF817 domain-containing protein [Paenibacillus glycanilyticus]